MGKTPKPLKIVAFGGVQDWPELVKLAEQGHQIVSQPDFYDLSTADIVIGPTAHRMSESERPWLDEAIAEARRRRYLKPGETNDPS